MALSTIANVAARRLWYGMIWLMRRRWMRRLQTFSMRWMAPERRERAYRGLVKQNAFARRIGLPMLRVMFQAILVSIAISCAYHLSVALIQDGYLARPESPSDNLR